MISIFRRIVQKISRDYRVQFLSKKNFEPNVEYFQKIQREHLFGRSESFSGPGSSIAACSSILEQLPLLLSKFSVTSIADAPCGDSNWIQHLDLQNFDYTGFDIVPELINSSTRKYPNSKFKVLDVTAEILPRKDLIICRDLFVHLTLNQSLKALSNFKQSKSRYLLATTFTELISNRELVTPIIGVGWRPLNLEVSPFNLGQPLALINEGSREGWGKNKDKSLGLWKIN